MDRTCKNCKWYTDGDQADSHTCDQPKALIGYSHWLHDLPNDGVWIENDEGWAWYVGPDFGCVNFEQANG